LQFYKQWEDSAILLDNNRPFNKDQTKQQRKIEREKNRERLRTIEEILTLGFDYVTPILEIHLGNTIGFCGNPTYSGDLINIRLL
jgi:hypothetical protein